ncbi:MAG TPA: hypothetical protein VGH80_13775 [Xanthomonadaceae bacterium]|jgi:hypothetical protein
MQRFPTWTIIVATTVVLYGGLIVLAHLIPDAHAHKPPLLKLPSLDRIIFVGIPVYLLEALFFTAGAIEVSAKFASMPLLGAAAGVLGYGVLYHWSHGLSGIILASWIALVLNASYLVLRARSRKTAILSTVGQKLTFLLFAVLGLYAFGTTPHQAGVFLRAPRPDYALKRTVRDEVSLAIMRSGLHGRLA